MIQEKDFGGNIFDTVHIAPRRTSAWKNMYMQLQSDLQTGEYRKDFTWCQIHEKSQRNPKE